MAAPGNRIGKKEKNEDFYKAILLLKDEEECYSFFRDVCTIAELRAMETLVHTRVYGQTPAAMV